MTTKKTVHFFLPFGGGPTVGGEFATAVAEIVELGQWDVVRVAPATVRFALRGRPQTIAGAAVANIVHGFLS
jgi:hypothetical protein